jgi:hypothetical protein
MVFAFILSGFVSLARTVRVRQQLHDAARLAAFLKASGVVADATVQAEITRLIDDDRLSSIHPIITLGRYTTTPSSRFYQLTEARVRALYQGHALDESVVLENAGDKT